MALNKQQWRRRLNAAAELRGEELQKLPVEWEGLPKRALVRASQDSDTLAPNKHIASAAAEYFDLPLEWFTVEDFDRWIKVGSEPSMASETHLMVAELWAESTGHSLDEALVEVHKRAETPSRTRTGTTEGSPNNG